VFFVVLGCGQGQANEILSSFDVRLREYAVKQLTKVLLLLYKTRHDLCCLEHPRIWLTGGDSEGGLTDVNQVQNIRNGSVEETADKINKW
jgi:hypothetical protein